MSCFWASYLNSSEPDCGVVPPVGHIYFTPSFAADGISAAYTDTACTVPADAITTATLTKVQAFDLAASECGVCLFFEWQGGSGGTICGGFSSWRGTGTESPPIGALLGTFDDLGHALSVGGSGIYIDAADYAATTLNFNSLYPTGWLGVFSITTDAGSGLYVASNFTCG